MIHSKVVSWVVLSFVVLVVLSFSSIACGDSAEEAPPATPVPTATPPPSVEDMAESGLRFWAPLFDVHSFDSTLQRFEDADVVIVQADFKTPLVDIRPESSFSQNGNQLDVSATCVLSTRTGDATADPKLQIDEGEGGIKDKVEFRTDLRLEGNEVDCRELKEAIGIDIGNEGSDTLTLVIEGRVTHVDLGWCWKVSFESDPCTFSLLGADGLPNFKEAFPYRYDNYVDKGLGKEFRIYEIVYICPEKINGRPTNACNLTE